MQNFHRAIRYNHPVIPEPEYGYFKQTVMYILLPENIIDVISVFPSFSPSTNLVFLRIIRLTKVFRLLKFLKFGTILDYVYETLHTSRKVLLFLSLGERYWRTLLIYHYFSSYSSSSFIFFFFFYVVNHKNCDIMYLYLYLYFILFLPHSDGDDNPLLWVCHVPSRRRAVHLELRFPGGVHSWR